MQECEGRGLKYSRSHIQWQSELDQSQDGGWTTVNLPAGSTPASGAGATWWPTHSLCPPGRELWTLGRHRSKWCHFPVPGTWTGDTGTVCRCCFCHRTQEGQPPLAPARSPSLPTVPPFFLGARLSELRDMWGNSAPSSAGCLTLDGSRAPAVETFAGSPSRAPGHGLHVLCAVRFHPGCLRLAFLSGSPPVCHCHSCGPCTCL